MVDGLLAQFALTRTEAVRRYVRFVTDGVGQGSIWWQLRQQVYLGDEAFIERAQAAQPKLAEPVGVPRAQRRRPPPPLSCLAERYPERDLAIVAAHATGAYSYQQIADHFGLQFTTVGKIVRRARNKGWSD